MSDAPSFKKPIEELSRKDISRLFNERKFEHIFYLLEEAQTLDEETFKQILDEAVKMPRTRITSDILLAFHKQKREYFPEIVLVKPVPKKTLKAVVAKVESVTAEISKAAEDAIKNPTDEKGRKGLGRNILRFLRFSFAGIADFVVWGTDKISQGLTNMKKSMKKGKKKRRDKKRFGKTKAALKILCLSAVSYGLHYVGGFALLGTAAAATYVVAPYIREKTGCSLRANAKRLFVKGIKKMRRLLEVEEKDIVPGEPAKVEALKVEPAHAVGKTPETSLPEMFTEDFEMPVNIKQVGSIGEGPRIYMEDYAYTFLQRCALSGGYDERLAFLVGKNMVIDGQEYLFIPGAIQGEHLEKDGYTLRFSDESVKHAEVMLEKYFPGMEIVGWMQSQPGYGVYLNYQYANYHMEQFRKPHQVMFVNDPIERVNEFYAVKQDDATSLEHKGGYFIYYERNPNMRQYILENEIYTKPEEPVTRVHDSLNEKRAERKEKPPAAPEKVTLLGLNELKEQLEIMEANIAARLKFMPVKGMKYNRLRRASMSCGEISDHIENIEAAVRHIPELEDLKNANFEEKLSALMAIHSYFLRNNMAIKAAFKEEQEILKKVFDPKNKKQKEISKQLDIFVPSLNALVDSIELALAQYGIESAVNGFTARQNGKELYPDYEFDQAEYEKMIEKDFELTPCEESLDFSSGRYQIESIYDQGVMIDGISYQDPEMRIKPLGWKPLVR